MLLTGIKFSTTDLKQIALSGYYRGIAVTLYRHLFTKYAYQIQVALLTAHCGALHAVLQTNLL
jgi:hypothetical protein